MSAASPENSVSLAHRSQRASVKLVPTAVIGIEMGTSFLDIVMNMLFCHVFSGHLSTVDAIILSVTNSSAYISTDTQ